MFVFVWNFLSKVSDNYHTEGGIVVFASSEERARSLANAEQGCEIEPDEMPDRITACEDGPEQVFIFVNAGCC